MPQPCSGRTILGGLPFAVLWGVIETFRLSIERDELAGLWVRQRIEQDAVDYGKERRIRANAQCQRQYRNAVNPGDFAGGAAGARKLNSATTRYNQGGSPFGGLCTTSVWMLTGKTIDYCVKDASGRVYAAGSIPATRLALDILMRKNGLNCRTTLWARSYPPTYSTSHLASLTEFLVRAPAQTGGPCLTRTYYRCLRGAACRVVIRVDVIFLGAMP